MVSGNSPALPVVDKNKNYLGVLTINKLLEAYSTYTAADQQGDVIQIVLNYNDLYISEISRIIENEDARIINLFVVPISESTQIRLIIKLNKNKKGFSLVELLVAVAIIAIMTPVLVNGFTFAANCAPSSFFIIYMSPVFDDTIIVP